VVALLASVIACLVVTLLTGAGIGPATASGVRPPPPAITQVGPVQGTRVTIRGRHLRTARAVTFGGSKGTELRVENDHKVTVLAPPHLDGTVGVRVTTRGGTTAPHGADASFTFVGPTRQPPTPPTPPAPPQPPSVDSFEPVADWPAGGARVTVTGSGFSDATAVTFDGLPGTGLRLLSPTRLSVTAPAHALGAVDLVVTAPRGSSVPGAASRFTYIPRLTAVPAPLPADAAPDRHVSLLDVACPAASRCFAVGRYDRLTDDDARPLVEQLDGGVWTAVEPPLPPDTSDRASADLESVSCPATTACVALGYYSPAGVEVQRTFVETWDGAAWTPQRLPVPANILDDLAPDLHKVSCGSPTTCVVAGSYDSDDEGFHGLLVTLADGAWTAQVAPLPAGGVDGELVDVDCAAAGACTAVGDYSSVGTDQLPLVVTLASGTWTAIPPPLPVEARTSLPAAYLSAVDCVSPSRCTAVGSAVDDADAPRAMAEVEGPAGWRVVTVPPPTSAQVASADLDDVSCSAPGSCTAVGGYALVGASRVDAEVVEVAEADATAMTLSSPDGSVAWLREVDCAAGGGCAASGQTGQRTEGALVASGVGTAMVPRLVDMPESAWAAQLSGVAGDSPTTAVAVGWLGTTSPSDSDAVLITGIPR
jgi:hypothetical protein